MTQAVWFIQKYVYGRINDKVDKNYYVKIPRFTGNNMGDIKASAGIVKA